MSPLGLGITNMNVTVIVTLHTMSLSYLKYDNKLLSNLLKRLFPDKSAFARTQNIVLRTLPSFTLHITEENTIPFNVGKNSFGVDLIDVNLCKGDIKCMTGLIWITLGYKIYQRFGFSYFLIIEPFKQ